MSTLIASRSEPRREAAGFLVSVGFVCLASVRDVFLGGLFQRVSPPLIAFPDENAFCKWYDAPERQAIAMDRNEGADTLALLVKGVTEEK